MSVRDVLNAGDANRSVDVFRQLGLGDIINTLLKNTTYTETGVTVTSNKATLANQPQKLWSVNATAGGTTGEKALLQGPITGTKAITPATGQAVWDGAKTVLFASADAVTTAKFLYSQSTDVTIAAMTRVLGQSDALI